MEAYTGLAEVYDSFMDDTPYEEWCLKICDHLKEHKITGGLVLDLGCGTGIMTRLLKSRGYDMIGADSSGDMLSKARDLGGDDILYIEQDMRRLDLFGTVSAVVCLCDSINYITDREELVRVFSLVNNYLDPGGIFIFDINTVHKYKDILSDSCFCENRQHESFICENYFYEDEMINEYDLTLFIERKDHLYEKINEQHIQRAYTIDEITGCIKRSGLELIGIYGEDMLSPASDADERQYFLAREKGKLP